LARRAAIRCWASSSESDGSVDDVSLPESSSWSEPVLPEWFEWDSSPSSTDWSVPPGEWRCFAASARFCCRALLACFVAALCCCRSCAISVRSAAAADFTSSVEGSSRRDCGLPAAVAIFPVSSASREPTGPGRRSRHLLLVCASLSIG
jgi:hypothetical protein